MSIQTYSGTPLAFLNDKTLYKYTRGALAFVSFFLSRYISEDYKTICGSIFDTAIVKSITLCCILLQATDSLRIALVMTTVILIGQYLLSFYGGCHKNNDSTQDVVDGRKIVTRGKLWPQRQPPKKTPQPKPRTPTIPKQIQSVQELKHYV